jgi:hypothetical protein
MCEKQCRDENGFKCHTMSEAHQRQMGLFAENPVCRLTIRLSHQAPPPAPLLPIHICVCDAQNKYLSDYSRDFEKDFMDILRRR